MIYLDFKFQVICNAALTDAFSVTTGVKQGCMLSPFLFILGIDWVMKQVTSGGKRGIRWTLTSVLEDLDYADDIAPACLSRPGHAGQDQCLGNYSRKCNCNCNCKSLFRRGISFRTILYLNLNKSNYLTNINIKNNY